MAASGRPREERREKRGAVESWQGDDVVVIRSRQTPPRSPRRRRSPSSHAEDRREQARRIPSRLGGGQGIEDFESRGKGGGRVSSRDVWWDGGGGAAPTPASLEPAWQVNARRRQRVQRAILQAAAVRGVSAPSEDEMSDGDYHGSRRRRWSQPPPPPQDWSDDAAGPAPRRWGYESAQPRSRPPPSKGKGGGKGGKYDGGAKGGYQVSSTRVHVSNLPKDVTEGQVQQEFRKHGDVLGLQLLSGGRNSAPGRICAIVRFSSSADAEKSIAALHQKEVRPGDGPISLMLAKPNPRWDM